MRTLTEEKTPLARNNPVPAGPTDEMPAPGLKRALSMLDVVMINVGTMIGSGIFFVPTAIAHHLNASAPILAVWLVCGLVSMLGALSVAELGAAMPHAGGQYIYLRKAYGPVWGFLYGWTAFSVINSAAIAAIAIAFATYLGYFMPLSPGVIKGVALGLIALLSLINCFGVKLGARVQNGMTFLKIGAMVALIVMSFVLSGGSVAHLTPVMPSLDLMHLSGPLGLAMIAALWAYDGWIQLTYVAGEIQSPQRTIPRALVISTLMVIGVYVLINLGYLYVLSVPGVAKAELVASETAKVLLGTAGAAMISVAVMVSTFGGCNSFVLTSARIYYAMAKEGVFFKSVARIHPEWRTPVGALVAQWLWSSILVLSGSFEQLFTCVVFASWIFYAMSASAVLLLRRREPDLPRPYRTWGYPLTPILFIAFAVWLVGNAIVEAPTESMMGTGIILAGLPAYFYWKRQNKMQGQASGS